MYFVEVYTELLPGERITRYLDFISYSSASNCILTLLGKEPGAFSPEDFFQAATIHKKRPTGEQLGKAIQTDWVLTYSYND